MKRFLSTFLVICLMIPVFSVFSANAFAAKDYSEYVNTVVVKKGDTMYSICKTANLKYDNVKKAIVIANGFSSEDNLGALKIGQKVQIPKTEADAKLIVELYNKVYEAEIPSGNVVTYKVKKGDTMYSICKSLKLDFNKSKSAIMNLNGWTDESKLSAIKIGQEIKFPSSDAAAKDITSIITTAQQNNINVTASSNDELKYYIVKHTMQKGETLKSVSKSYGVSYVNASDMIIAVNNISNPSKVLANASYYFLSDSADGASYAVYKHKIVAGDTVNNLCKSYGVNYKDVSSMLQGLNPKTNLNSIKVGGTILLVAPLGGTSKTPIVIK